LEICDLVSPENIAKAKSCIEEFDKIQLALIYGSFSKGQQKATSDIDVAVAGTHKLSMDEKLDVAQSVSKVFKREVDLVDLKTVSGLILQQALTQGKIILNRKPGIYAELLKKMWFNQADMMPNHRMILEKRRKRFFS
jgi:uncharacterized protein